ncbi:MAG: AAA family ATPase [SAR202 cluster bacterium]|nr:AAA family ATPase [SAR202 cluster bacterium]|tara:strand:+ start:1551 stop:2927 length:1377 start_codon:yes stop_codon:yes gene_type:complete
MEELGKILKKVAITNTSEDNKSNESLIPKKNNPCPECNGVGWQTKNVPVGHQDFGEILICSCQSTKIDTEKTKKLYRYSNLESLKRFKFETLKDDYWKSDTTVNLEYLKSLTEIKKYTDSLKGWLILTGPHGSGKTHLASAIGHSIIDKGHLVLFVHVPDLVDHLKSTFHPTSDTSYSELFEQVKNTPYLILDDLGLQISSPWAQEKLRQILNYRYNLELPTVITIGENLSKFDPYILSRIKDTNNGKIIDLSKTISKTTTSIGDIPIAMQKTMTFGNFILERQNLTSDQYSSLSAALKSSQSFAQNPDGWLTLYGETGVGKTHLAIAIAVEQIKNNSNVFFAFVPELMDHLRFTYNPQSDVQYDTLFDEVKNASLLILDDLGKERSSTWAIEKLYQIIVHRHNSRLPTVITSMLDFKDELDPITSRVQDGYISQVVPIKAPDYRNKKKSSSRRYSKR